jgi:two-component system cell cycle response regulator
MAASGARRAFRKPSMSTVRSAKARTYRVALEGFSEFERGMLASFFRLAERHTPAYEHVPDSTQSDLIVANADQAQLLERIIATRRVNDTVFVGAKAPREAIARVERPIEPTQILRELDQLVALRTVRIGLDLELPVAGLEAVPDSVDLLLHDISPQSDHSTAGGLPHPGHGGGRAVLVVDDSPIARKFLDARLRRLGYAVQSAASGEHALELAARECFAIVFLDVGPAPADSAGAQLEGLLVCQRIRQRAQQRGEAVPAVVLTTGSASSTERVRGSLAGCDGYLTKPLLDAEFFEVLGTVDPLFRPRAVGAIG